MAIKQLVCSGSPHQIGYAHGQGAQAEIERCIAFYAKLFMKISKLDWPQVQEVASTFNTLICAKWPRYHQELQGVADGAKRDILDIIALNVRTEIVFGQFSDGCTSLFCRDKEYAYMGQNWDWMEDQQSNLVQLTIIQEGLPSIHMITEAGMIGKIGFNSHGVGVCFNAIRAKGLDENLLPVHLGLRLALESTSAPGAVKALEDIGIASSAHILIGDATTAIGLEFTSSTFAKVPLNKNGFVVHTNHMLLPHENICEPEWLEDSPTRIETMERNISRAGGLSWESFSNLFEDETNYPCAINRAAAGVSEIATLFNIVMDLREKKAVVRMGRPVQGDESVDKVHLSFP